ncbi:CvfB family protein [Olivibacter sitiensis]|uniref:CvfB family protein n=1 Tax=Olivibacter sitiensis TaxID=376470 RepID=UPI0003FC911F|nr:S1-like domain-containing RNA-binding protein [Olivibacter sitiensis]
MIEIGNYNTLNIKYITPDGSILTDGKEEVYLPPLMLDNEKKVGDQVEAFVYFDKNDKLVGTTKTVYATVDSFAYLKVVDDHLQGVFMDMGTGKDLFVPKAEQRFPLHKGQRYVIFVYLDQEKKHLLGSTKLNKFINHEPQGILSEKEEVELLISEETDLGYNAIINNEFIGLIYENEVFQTVRVGQKMRGWIKRFTAEGKIDLSLQPIGFTHIMDSKGMILDALKKNGGVLSLGDKSAPEEIYRQLRISKKTFKRSIGGLYKENLIELDDHEIRLANNS